MALGSQLVVEIKRMIPRGHQEVKSPQNIEVTQSKYLLYISCIRCCGFKNITHGPLQFLNIYDTHTHTRSLTINLSSIHQNLRSLYQVTRGQVKFSGADGR